MTSRSNTRNTAGPAAHNIAPVKCALKFKPPTLVLFYKDLQSGKTRRRSMPLRGLQSESSVSQYASKLLVNPKHRPFLSQLPRPQLDSLLQRVKDAQHPPTSRDPSRQTTLLGEMPPLKFATAPQNDGGLGDQFESALAELLQLEGGATAEGTGSGRSQQPASDSSRNHTFQEAPPTGQEAPPTGQEATPTGQEALPHLPGRRLPLLVRDSPSGALSETRTKPLPGIGLPGEKEGEGGGASLGGWLTGFPRAEGTVTSSRIAGTLPPLPAASSGKPTSLQEGMVQGTGTRDSFPLWGEGPPRPRLQAVPVQQVKETTPLPPTSSVQGPASTFPTEVPEYSADFSSEKERPAPLLLAAEDKSLSFEISEVLDQISDNDLSLSGDDHPPDFGEAGQLLPLSPEGIVTGESSDEGAEQPRPLIPEEGEDLNLVSAELLARRKAEMEELFAAHRVAPGDPGYVYDREVEFGVGKIESGWDECSSSEDF